MFGINKIARVAIAGAAVALAACSDNPKLLGPATPAGGDIFRSYVALGNSITAGYQSGGINDSTQRESYARLLAGQMGTQYHYAALTLPGCPPPIANVLTGARIGVTTSTSTTCKLRIASSV